MKNYFDKLFNSKFLNNKITLYVIFFLSLVTIFSYLVSQNYPAILFFSLVVFLTKYFSNNLVIILGISIVATNLLHLFRVFSLNNVEGLDNNNKSASKNKKKQKNTEKLTNLNPASVSELKSGSGNVNKLTNSKLKEAVLDDLDNIIDIDNDQIKAMAKDTIKMNNKQDELMQYLNEFKPIITQAMNLINNVDINSMTELSKKLGGMINNLESLKQNDKTE